MRLKLILFLTSLFIVFSFNTEAQAWKSLLNNAKKHAAQKVQREANKMVDKTLDKAVDKTTKKITEKINKKKADKKANTSPSESKNYNSESEISASESQTKASNNASDAKKTDNSDEDVMNLFNKMSGANDLKYDDSYTFDAELKYRIESFDKSGKSKGVAFYRTLLSNSNQDAAMIFEPGKSNNQPDNGSGSFIFDTRNHVFIMLSKSDKKEGFVMGTNGDDNVSKETNDNSSDAKEDLSNKDEYGLHYKKTGRTKKILGYTCEEYVATEDNTENHIWGTKEVKFNSSTALNRLNAFSGNYSAGLYPSGFLMEINTKDLKTGESTLFKVVEFSDHKNNTLSLKGFKLAKIGSNLK